MAGDKWSWNGTIRRQFKIKLQALNERWIQKGAYLILNLFSLEVLGIQFYSSIPTILNICQILIKLYHSFIKVHFFLLNKNVIKVRLQEGL